MRADAYPRRILVDDATILHRLIAYAKDTHLALKTIVEEALRVYLPSDPTLDTALDQLSQQAQCPRSQIILHLLAAALQAQQPPTAILRDGESLLICYQVAADSLPPTWPASPLMLRLERPAIA